jgi:hypothetical protein
MRSFAQIARRTMGRPLLADEIVEFHAARLLLLIDMTKRHRIDGLTKLAKLDFFVRYPAFFEQACRAIGAPAIAPHREHESQMIRYHYGPWDPRYYQVIPFLEARGLLSVEESTRGITFAATEEGTRMATMLRRHTSYAQLRDQIEAVLKTFGSHNGNQLKKLIYAVFKPEVAEKKMGEQID